MFSGVSWHMGIIHLSHEPFSGMFGCHRDCDYIHYTTTHRTPWTCHHYMKPSDTVTRVDGKARKLFQGPIKCLPPADQTPRTKAERNLFALLSFCQIYGVIFWSFSSSNTCNSKYAMSKYSWRSWFLWWFALHHTPCVSYTSSFCVTHIHTNTRRQKTDSRKHR